MRNYFLLVLSFIGPFSSAQQHGFKSGIIVGGNMSILKGADSKKFWVYCNEIQYLPGYSTGLYISRKFPKLGISGRIEIKYTRRGTKCIHSYLGVPLIDKLILEYAEIPLLLYFTISGKREHKIYAGITVARLVGSTMKIDDLSGNPGSVWFPIMKTDFVFTIGYRFNLGNHLYAVLAYARSIDTIIPKFSVYNQSLSLNLNYEF